MAVFQELEYSRDTIYSSISSMESLGSTEFFSMTWPFCPQNERTLLRWFYPVLGQVVSQSERLVTFSTSAVGLRWAAVGLLGTEAVDQV